MGSPAHHVHFAVSYMTKNKHHMPPNLPGPSAAPPPDLRAAATAIHIQRRSESRGKRLHLIRALEAARHSRIIAYVTSGRGLLGTQISMDAIRLFRDQLGSMGTFEQLDLLLITRGGDTLVPLRLMALLREFAQRVNVLVPYMAHSSGTLIALGADEIIMGAMGELGPVDPSVANQFNPVQEAEDQQPNQAKIKPRPRISISVEDVVSYINFAKNNAALDADGMAQAHAALTEDVHPLAIGNILRTHNLIRHLARRLLAMHMQDEQKAQIDAIVKSLTEELYAHNYVITRAEAPLLGLKVKKPAADIETLMWQLYQEFEQALGIDRMLNLPQELGSMAQNYLCYDLAVIENSASGVVNLVAGLAKKNGTDVDLNIDSQGWQPL